jgi:uncharacterized protein (DUF1778 family)
MTAINESEILAQQNLALSQQDWSRFINVLDNPPPANAALQQALTEYRLRGSVAAIQPNSP